MAILGCNTGIGSTSLIRNRATVCATKYEAPTNMYVNSISVSVGQLAGTWTFSAKGQIWNSSGIKISGGTGSSDSYTGVGDPTLESTYSSKPLLREGVEYYIGAVVKAECSSAYTAWLGACNSTGYESKIGLDYTYGYYNTLPNINGFTNGTMQYKLWADYTQSTPLVLIEGITPDKLEYTSWDDLIEIN